LANLVKMEKSDPRAQLDLTEDWSLDD